MTDQPPAQAADTPTKGKQMNSDTEFAWLIEAPGPMYLAVREVANRATFHWSEDYCRAIRFYNREQAESVMAALYVMDRDLFAFALTLRPAQAVKHGWIARAANPERDLTGACIDIARSGMKL